MRIRTHLIQRLVSLRARPDKGYVIALTGLLLVPLMVATAFAVDLGAWQSRAAELQRASDAAALAGVVELPDVALATQKARQVAAANGFDWTTTRYDVNVSQVTSAGGDSSRLRVQIIDNDADKYFSGVVMDGPFSIERQATAEFIKPVKMGSPKNFLGTGQLQSGNNRENFWLAISGYCASREQGERIATVSDGNFTTTSNPPGSGNGWANCRPGLDGGPNSYVERNPEYDSTGYFYALNLKQNYSGSLAVQVFDAPNCNGAGSGSGDTGGTFTTTYRMRSNNSSNPLTATVLNTWTLAPGASGYCNAWQTLHTLNNPTAGTYYIQVTNQVGWTNQQGSNQFGLRIRENGSYSPCTGDPVGGTADAPYRANCPNLHGLENMGVIANFSGATPSFFLADLGPEHNNKVMEITMWDMGEGSQYLRILDPLGNRATFNWTVLCLDGTAPVSGSCAGETNPTGGRTGTTNNLYVGGTGNQPRAHRLSSSRYNDRLMRIEVQLPANIATAYGGRTWWRVQYEVNSAPTDRTTWSVIVRGDPVRLVPD